MTQLHTQMKITSSLKLVNTKRSQILFDLDNIKAPLIDLEIVFSRDFDLENFEKKI